MLVLVEKLARSTLRLLLLRPILNAIISERKQSSDRSHYATGNDLLFVRLGIPFPWPPGNYSR